MRQVRNTIRKTAAASAAFVGGAVLSLGVSAAPAHAAASYQGCPSGYVCLYPNAS